MKKNYYEILGISKDATQEQIMNAVKEIIAKEHPKKGSERFKELEEIYNTLMDPVKREQYDKVIDFVVTIPEKEQIDYKPEDKKNYYGILGVSKAATREEIYEPTKRIIEKEKLKKDSERWKEVDEAYTVLIDPEKRKEYDEMLAESEKEFPSDISNIQIQPKAKKTLKKSIIFKVLPVLAAVVIGVVGCNAINSSKKRTNDDDSSVSSSQSVDDVNSTDVPEQEEKLLTAENIDEKVQEILADNQSKGLNIDPTFIKSALFITNIDYLDQEDIKKMWGNDDLNIMEEIQNMYNYVSAVRTHNSNGREFISLIPLAYDEEDKIVLTELETELKDLITDLKTDKITDEEFQASFKYITEFYTGEGTLTTGNKEYNNYSLTNGGGLLSEQYWPMFSVIYASSQFVTSENQIDIKTLSENVINGSKYLGSIVNHESLQCLEETPVSEVSEEKTLTKTR